MILSVSRRTDIPAFYPQWFMNRVNEKYVYVRNAFNANQISNISLDPKIIDCIVFWSKNPAPLLPYLETIDIIYNGAFYFQYSINDYGKEIEPCGDITISVSNVSVSDTDTVIVGLYVNIIWMNCLLFQMLLHLRYIFLF